MLLLFNIANKLLVANAIFYIAYFAIIGLPIWYLTTTTYRAALPYDQVDATFHAMQHARFRINLEVIALQDNDNKPDLSQLKGLSQKLVEILNQSEIDEK